MSDLLRKETLARDVEASRAGFDRNVETKTKEGDDR
jgi:hypothetical protein